jgi:hypothetical protein
MSVDSRLVRAHASAIVPSVHKKKNPTKQKPSTRAQSLVAKERSSKNELRPQESLPQFPPNPDKITFEKFQELLGQIESRDDIDKLRAALDYAHNWVDVVQDQIKQVLEISAPEATVSFKVREASSGKKYLEAKYWDGASKAKYIRPEK